LASSIAFSAVPPMPRPTQQHRLLGGAADAQANYQRRAGITAGLADCFNRKVNYALPPGSRF
jgi:hypothetical protein